MDCNREALKTSPLESRVRHYCLIISAKDNADTSDNVQLVFLFPL